MANTWVIVADGSRARFFNRHRNRQLEEFDTLVSPGHRLHEGDLVTGREGDGRSYDPSGSGSGRHSMGGDRNSAKEHELVNFAKRLSARVDEGRNTGEINRLVLVAPPKFLGHLRANLSHPSAGLVALTIDKELTTLPVDKLAQHLPEFF